MNNLENFWWFCKERESIRLLKDAGMPRPWTDDPILNRHKFTNIDRRYDRGTVLLWNLINEIPDSDAIFATVIYRFSGSMNGHIEMMHKTNSEHWENKIKNTQKLFNMTAYQANWGSGKGRGMDFLKNITFPLSVKIHEYLKTQSDVKFTISEVANKICDYLAEFGYPRMRFQSTEVAKDLAERFSNIIDVNSDCHLGPGAIKGIKYIWPPSAGNKVPRGKKAVQKLLEDKSNPGYNWSVLEHALCEYSKWVDYGNGARAENNKVYKPTKKPMPKL
jgi:hypothetical protein